MSKFRINVNRRARGKFKGSAADLSKIIDDRMNVFAKHMGRKIVAEAAKHVHKKIPDRGGWIGVYKDAIKFVENNSDQMKPEWGVAAMTTVDLTQLPAENTLIAFPAQTQDAATSILASHNPWTVDDVPAIADGYNSNIMAIPASESEVNKRREALAEILPNVRESLSNAGITWLKDALPTYNGIVRADMNFLAKRLRYGIAGFELKPHWRPASSLIRTKTEAWLKKRDTQKLFTDAFGENKLEDEIPSSDAEFVKISKAQAKKLSQKRSKL